MCLPAGRCGPCLLAVILLKKEPVFQEENMEENACIWELEALKSPWLMHSILRPGSTGPSVETLP